ncbi:MAG: methionyl-tRNA formyltransferase [Ruminococcaceae bacterium]|nr:methionyl-tRNA formyltransferase [Oscillospiraceae bacterium]
MKIVFMGTPDFSVPTLKALIDNHEVMCVVTKADRPKGRGNVMTAPPVKILIEEHNAKVLSGEIIGNHIDIMQPESFKGDNLEPILNQLKSYDADVFVTISYGKILPQAVLDIPKKGCINVHASLLPELRGAAPIWHSIINGDKQSGVTTMMTDKGIDTGDMLLTETVDIDDDMTTGQLHDKLAEISGPVLLKTLDMLEAGTLVRIPQDHSKATYAAMVDRETGHIDWNKTAWEIHNLIRGTNPFPSAYTTEVSGMRVKIHKSCIFSQEIISGKEPGTVLKADKEGIDVVTGYGVLRILELQAEGARRMAAGDFTNGHKVTKFA